MSRHLEGEFLQYCHDNNLEEVTDCLTRGVDVNTVSEDGRWSGLTIAADRNYPELLEILLSQPDIKINHPVRDAEGVTALMFACAAGNSAIVSRLVQVPGLDINYLDENDDTAAHGASWHVHTDCLRILAETGIVNWNKRHKWVRGVSTPLSRALYRGFSDIVDIIMEQPNIDYNVKTRNGETLGHAAVWGANVKCVESLIAQERFDCWNIPDGGGDTPIMTAVMLGHSIDPRGLRDNLTEISKILLRCPRVNPNCRDKEGWSVVFRAIQKNELGKLQR